MKLGDDLSARIPRGGADDMGGTLMEDLHKIRNVQDRLPDKLRSVVASRMRRPYHADSALAAEAELSRWPASSTAPIPARRRACARA